MNAWMNEWMNKMNEKMKWNEMRWNEMKWNEWNKWINQWIIELINICGVLLFCFVWWVRSGRAQDPTHQATQPAAHYIHNVYVVCCCLFVWWVGSLLCLFAFRLFCLFVWCVVIMSFCFSEVPAIERHIDLFFNCAVLKESKCHGLMGTSLQSLWEGGL
jgi:hypothetical protein